MEYLTKTTCLDLICPVYVVFYNGISAKNDLLVYIDLICPVYVIFYDGISAKNHLLVNIDLICPVYVVFYNGISNKNNLLALIDIPNMSSVRSILRWNIRLKQLVSSYKFNMSSVRRI